MALSQFFAALLIAVVGYGLARILRVVYREFSSPLRALPGLTSKNVILGNMKEVVLSDQTVVPVQLVERYGTTFKFKSLLWKNWLFTADVKTISHILKNDTGIWQKDTALVYTIASVVGPGLLLVDSEVHRKQRKILNPAFSPSEIKGYMSTVLDKSVKLRDTLSSQVQQSSGGVQIEVLSWLSKAALEMVGEIGFGYEFNALNEDSDHPNELHEAFQTMLSTGSKPNLIRLMRGLMPITRRLTTKRDKESQQAKEILARIGKQLLMERELALDSQHSDKASFDDLTRDILSFLVKANASGGDHQRIPDEQVLAQIPTFVIAGYETTGTGSTWVLFALSQYPAVQARLREELLSMPTENPTMDELNSLPYLDAVIREALRLYPPVPRTMRIATEDDVLPLSNPITDADGKVHNEIRVEKGQTVLIAIAAVNRLKTIWGEDADAFNPDRWKSLPEAVTSIPGVWGNSLSFFGGPRACIGYRFAIIEIKALVFMLLRAFTFELAVPAEDILKHAGTAMRPILRTDPEGHNQLPLIVRPATV